MNVMPDDLAVQMTKSLFRLINEGYYVQRLMAELNRTASRLEVLKLTIV